MTTRRLLSLIHGAIGVLVALFIILVGGTGGALAFMSEMFMAEYGQILRVEIVKSEPYADVDRLIAGAKAGLDGKLAPVGVFMPHTRIEHAETALVFGLPEGSTDIDELRMVSVDPWSGVYKGDFRLHDAFGYALVHFHHQLFAEEVGTAFVSALGLLLVAFALTGVWLWWPRGGSAWRKAWPPDVRGGARRAWFRLHGWVGVWIALLIMLFSLTGTGAASPDWFGPLLSDLYEAPAGAGFERVCEGGQVMPGEAVRAAETRWPGRSLASLYFPFGPGNPYRMAFSAPGDLNRLDGDFVVFAHAACSNVLYGSDMGRGSLSDSVSAIMLSLHGGYSLGILGDILVIVTGIALVLLSGSGVYVFFTRTLRADSRRQPIRSTLDVGQSGLRAES
jgi:uncharacterized iron-regulated membrane protein